MQETFQRRREKREHDIAGISETFESGRVYGGVCVRHCVIHRLLHGRRVHFSALEVNPHRLRGRDIGGACDVGVVGEERL